MRNIAVIWGSLFAPTEEQLERLRQQEAANEQRIAKLAENARTERKPVATERQPVAAVKCAPKVWRVAPVARRQEMSPEDRIRAMRIELARKRGVSPEKLNTEASRRQADRRARTMCDELAAKLRR